MTDPEHPPNDATMASRVRDLDPNVAALGAVSLFADFSSEIVYPLFPIFVTSVLGAPVAVLGLIEGVAEATASTTRYPFGQWSDYTGRRRVFTAAGYGLASLGKLLLAIAFVWPVALLGRFVDRLGKGIRTAPRDALIAASARPEERGIAFGLHRTLDSMGAILGPLLAILLIELDLSYRWIFAIAVIPGVISVGVIALFVRERRQAPHRAAFRLKLPPSPAFRWLLASSVMFGVGNSSDAFILLKAKSVGLGIVSVLLLYVLYNVTYSAASLPAGHLSDRIGQIPLVLGGYVVFAAVYVGFAAADSWAPLVILFAAYGLYIANTEGTSKALISKVTPQAEHGASMGLYYTASGCASFMASLIGGVLWSAVGPWATFTYGASCAFAAAIVLAIARHRVVETAIAQ